MPCPNVQIRTRRLLSITGEIGKISPVLFLFGNYNSLAFNTKPYVTGIFDHANQLFSKGSKRKIAPVKQIVFTCSLLKKISTSYQREICLLISSRAVLQNINLPSIQDVNWRVFTALTVIRFQARQACSPGLSIIASCCTGCTSTLPFTKVV